MPFEVAMVGELFNRFLRLGSGRATARLGGEIARRCLPGSVHLLRGTSASMRLAEARGYIRARTGGLVAQEVDATLYRLGAAAELRSVLAARASDELVVLTLREMLNSQLPRTVTFPRIARLPA
jgi:hypothetical protein